ncbi:MAG TPA: LemA family protein [bacterium]|nr:LemA family protein [bacterium]HPN42295.1 LemA family protein [bacterium]
MSYFIIFIVIPAAVAIWGVSMYNQLVRNRNLAEEGWSGVDVQLKRRTDLIPNVIEAVKGYMTHERELLTKVTDLRSKSVTTKEIAEKGPLENALSRSLSSLFVVAENYPDLKANQNFLDLQKQLADIEDQIQLARRYYNGTVRNLNIMIESFPSNLIAKRFNFTKKEFFEIEASDGAVPSVKFK